MRSDHPSRRRARRLGSRLAAAALVAAAPAAAWHTIGHRQVAIDAIEELGTDLPAFFRAGAATVGHLAVDPDLHRHPGTPALSGREQPDHYVDLERLEGHPPPANREELFALAVALGRTPPELGAVTLAVVEGTERLALCLAEHRRWPANPHVRSKCLVYAGLVAHYAADLVQPLHTTIHHDGWALPGGGSPLLGYHARIDSLYERVPFDHRAALEGLAPAPFPDLRAGVVAALADSHARVDAAYRLEPLLAARGGEAHPEVVAFTCERYRAAALLLARLFATAWERSATLELPSWLWRESERLEPGRPAPE